MNINYAMSYDHTEKPTLFCTFGEEVVAQAACTGPLDEVSIYKVVVVSIFH